MTSRNVSIHKLHVLILAMLFTIAVAGCGGGGGGRPAEPMGPQENLAAAQARAQEAVRAALAAKDAALAALNEVMAHRAADPEAYASAALRAADAETAYTDAQAASDAAQAATTVADAVRHADAAEDERDRAVQANEEAMRYADQVTASHNRDRLRTKNARLFASANGDDEETPAAKEARVGTVAVLVAAAAEAGRVLLPTAVWDLTAASNDDVTTETRGTSMTGVAHAEEGAAVVTWATNPDGGDPAARRFRIRIGTGVGTSTVLDTANASGGIPTNEQRPLPRIGAWEGFHGVELSSLEGGLYAHAYTDISQARIIPAQDAASVMNASVSLEWISDSVILTAADQAAGSFAGEYDHDGNPDTDPLSGTFSCGAGRACALDIDAHGRITAISGYTFTGRRDRQDERISPDEDYLVFGVWLNSPARLPSAGAFASGNRSFDVGLDGVTLRALTGTATYRGPATGMHSADGAIRPFDATATLTANFGEAAPFGTISGRIDNIVSAGTALPDPIVLVEAGLDRYTNTETGSFQGMARMGAVEDPAAATPVYPYNGHWSGRFYGPGARGTDYPGSAAGVFGVTGGEGEAQQSFVGAFAAHRQ